MLLRYFAPRRPTSMPICGSRLFASRGKRFVYGSGASVPPRTFVPPPSRAAPAMAFAAALQGFQQVPASQDDWIQFIKAIGNAYDADLAEVKTTMKDSKPLRSLLFDTHHKPIKYTDDRDSKLEVTFKQWIADVRSMIRRYSKKHAQMLDIAADRNIWNQSDMDEEPIEETFTS